MSGKAIWVFAAVAASLAFPAGLSYGVGEYTPDANTWALYHFNGDFQDASGNNRHLTVENSFGYIGFAPSWAGGFGSALHLTRTHQVEPGWPRTRLYSAALRYPGSGSWTVEALIYVDESCSGAKVAEHYSEGLAAHEPYSLQYFGSTQEAAWTIDDQSGTEWELTAPMSKGTWHHVAGVWDEAESKMKLYVDCQLRAEISASRPENLQSYNVYIGGDYYGIYGPIYLDEIRISTVARTPDEFICIPEPSTICLAALGVLIFLLRKRKR